MALTQLTVRIAGQERLLDETAEPLRVGSAADNDVVVADPRVAEHHLTIDHEGAAWVIRATPGSPLFSGGQALEAASVPSPITLALGVPGGPQLSLSPSANAPLSTHDTSLYLRTEEGDDRVFGPGKAVVVGSGADCDFVVEDSLVAPQHVRFDHGPTAWTLTDMNTQRGTYVDGKRIAGSVSAAGSFVVHLGAPTAGPALAVVTAGEHRSPRNYPAMVIAGVAALALLVAVIAISVARSGDDAFPALDEVRASVVKLSLFDAEGGSLGWGSGTVISDDGLILTNAHVADPNAPGVAAHYGVRFGPDVAYMTVGVTTAKDQPVEDTYRAELLASDGYLDIAVVQITGTADGSPIGPEDIDLPSLPIGDSDATATGDQVTILGFPGLANSRSLTVETGQVSSLTRDPRLDSDRAYFETTADVREGNSGGTAVNAQGELIGIPSSESFNVSRTESSNQIRPIEWAEEVLTVAKGGKDLGYVSPHVTLPSGKESVTFNGFSAKEDCAETEGTSAPAGVAGFWGLFTIDGADPDLDVFPALVPSEGGDAGAAAAFVDALPSGVGQAGDQPACIGFLVSEPLPAGEYQAAVLGYNADGPIVLGRTAAASIIEGTGGQTPSEGPSGGSTSSVPAGGTCNAGRAVPDWVGQQSIFVPGVTWQSNSSVLFEGGKTLVISLLGDNTGFGTLAEAAQAARSAVNHNLGPAPYPGVHDQRWVVVRDSAARYWAMLGQHRAEVIIINDQQDPQDEVSAIPNPDNYDWCMTPSTDYELVAWYGTVHDGDGTWSIYDSTTNLLSPL